MLDSRGAFRHVLDVWIRSSTGCRFPAAQRRVHDHRERVVVTEQRRILMAVFELNLLLDFAVRVGPENLTELIFDYSEGPADGVGEVEF